MKTTSIPKKDLYAQVTDEIIDTFEGGKTSQLKWARSGDSMPRNHKTCTAYQGVNVLLLWAAAATGGYSSDRWLTYKQATDMGGQVRKGEKSVTCVFFKTLEIKPENEDEEGEQSHSMRMIKPFWLFNLDQIDGIDKPQAGEPLTEFQQIEAAESVLIHSRADISEIGEKAFYQLSTDKIYLPERNRFASGIEFYSVALHELTHNADPRIMPRRMLNAPK